MPCILGFFENTRNGGIAFAANDGLRLFYKTMIGSSVSIALRNSLMFLGGFTMLLLTSARLTEYVFGDGAAGGDTDYYYGAESAVDGKGIAESGG